MEPLWSETEAPVPLGSHSQSTALVEPASNGDRAASSLPRHHHESEPSADDFAAERMLRTPARRPDSGWRRALFHLSAGHVRVAPSAAELRHRELVARVKTPIRGCRKIAFISRKGGVGKTSTCLLAGHTFAAHRGDRVIALDGNPDAGTLGHRVRRETTETVTSLLADAGEIERYADIRAYTSQSADPARGRRGGRRSADHAGDRRGRVQAGDPPARAALQPRLPRHRDGRARIGDARDSRRGRSGRRRDRARASTAARAASSTLDWLAENGYRHLVDGAVGVINGVRPYNGVVDLDRIESHFAGRCRATVRDPVGLASGDRRRDGRRGASAPRPVRPIWSSPPPSRRASPIPSEGGHSHAGPVHHPARRDAARRRSELRRSAGESSPTAARRRARVLGACSPRSPVSSSPPRSGRSARTRATTTTPAWASAERSISAGAALLIGAAPAIVAFFEDLGNTVS